MTDFCVPVRRLLTTNEPISFSFNFQYNDNGRFSQPARRAVARYWQGGSCQGCNITKGKITKKKLGIKILKSWK